MHEEALSNDYRCHCSAGLFVLCSSVVFRYASRPNWSVSRKRDARFLFESNQHDRHDFNHVRSVCRRSRSKSADYSKIILFNRVRKIRFRQWLIVSVSNFTELYGSATIETIFSRIYDSLDSTKAQDSISTCHQRISINQNAFGHFSNLFVIKFSIVLFSFDGFLRKNQIKLETKGRR